jgi:glutathione S-transferase
MLTLYYKPTCIHSQDVLGEAENLGISFHLKDVSFDMVLKEELIALGGKTQTPFLIDAENGVKMYESDDIIAYLKEWKERQKEKTFGGLKIHQSEEVCDSCQ